MDTKFRNQLVVSNQQRAALSPWQQRELARRERRISQFIEVAKTGIDEGNQLYQETVRLVEEDLHYVSYYKTLYFGNSVPSELAAWLPAVTRAHIRRMGQIPQEFSRNVLSVIERMPYEAGDEGIVEEIRGYIRGLLPPG